MRLSILAVALVAATLVLTACTATAGLRAEKGGLFGVTTDADGNPSSPLTGLLETVGIVAATVLGGGGAAALAYKKGKKNGAPVPPPQPPAAPNGGA